MVSQRSTAKHPHILVADTRAALGRLASAWRDKHQLKVVGVTGSNGKTTVKGMVAAILARLGPVLATEGNFNNEIGLPKTLFKLDANHQYAVLEMGANHQGEIARLAAIGKPDVAIVTLCAPAHLEGFGSIEGVARAKGEIFSSLPADGVAIINADDAYYEYWCGVAGSREVISFGVENTAADVSAKEIRSNGMGEGMSFTLDLMGREAQTRIPHDGTHNVMNALAAVAACRAVGCELDEIVAGLSHSDVVSGRLNIHQIDASTRVIDDTYNANPTSLIAAARVAAESGDDVWVVLGDMGELGPSSDDLHAQCGRDLKSLEIKKLFTHGEMAKRAGQAFGNDELNFVDKSVLSNRLLENLAHKEARALTILVKGSRTMRMETVVDDLLQHGDSSC